MAKPYLNIDPVEEPAQQPTKPQTPNAFKPAESDKQPNIKMPKESFMDLNRLVEAIQTHHNLAINKLEPPKTVASPPKSIKKELITTQKYYNRLLKVATTNLK